MRKKFKPWHKGQWLQIKCSIQFNVFILFWLVLFKLILAAQVTKSYLRRLPALARFYRETKFSLLNHDPLNLETFTKLRTFSWASRVPQSKFEANQSKGSEVMVGQTNRDYNFIYIDFPAYPWYFNNDRLFLNIDKINSKICHKQLFKICRRLRFHLFKNYYRTFWSKNINSIAKDCNISMNNLSKHKQNLTYLRALGKYHLFVNCNFYC